MGPDGVARSQESSVLPHQSDPHSPLCLLNAPLFVCLFVCAKEQRKKENDPLLVGLERTLRRASAQGRERKVGSVASSSSSSSPASSSSRSIHITVITMLMILLYQSPSCEINHFYCHHTYV